MFLLTLVISFEREDMIAKKIIEVPIAFPINH
jgi:hypothetical protein